MGRKLAGGTMPNDRSLRLFLRFPSTLDRDVLFIIMKDTSTILFNPKITRSASRRVWSESEPKQQQRSKGEVYTFDLFRKIRTYGEVENEWSNEREREREDATLFSRGARRVCIVTRRNGITFSGGSFPHSKLPGCHSNWPGAEQSGLLPAICQRISRYLFSSSFFLQGVASATRVQGVVFRFKKAAIHCSGSPHLSRPCSRN